MVFAFAHRFFIGSQGFWQVHLTNGCGHYRGESNCSFGGLILFFWGDIFISAPSCEITAVTAEQQNTIYGCSFAASVWSPTVQWMPDNTSGLLWKLMERYLKFSHLKFVLKKLKDILNIKMATGPYLKFICLGSHTQNSFAFGGQNPCCCENHPHTKPAKPK